MRFGHLNGALMVLTAAAVLLWPSMDSRLSMHSRGDVTSSSDETAPADGHHRSVDADTRVVRTGVPVADIAGVIELLALTLRGGVGLVEAMEAVASHVDGVLGMHLRTVAAASRWGVEDATAWASVPAAWQPAARALRIAASAGVPPADALVSAAVELRRSEQQRLEVATATLGIRIVLPLGLVFLPAFILTTVMPIVIALTRQVLTSQ
jgi:hypothetical protein